jgi:hypothetical protein
MGVATARGVPAVWRGQPTDRVAPRRAAASDRAAIQPMFSAILERRRPRTSRGLVLLLVLVLGFAAVYMGYVDFEWWRTLVER